MKRNVRAGSDFDDYLREEGLYDEAQAVAVKRVLALLLERDMKNAAQITIRLLHACNANPVNIPQEPGRAVRHG